MSKIFTANHPAVTQATAPGDAEPLRSSTGRPPMRHPPSTLKRMKTWQRKTGKLKAHSIVDLMKLVGMDTADGKNELAHELIHGNTTETPDENGAASR